MNYNKLIEIRTKISERIESIVNEDDFEFSIRYLTSIHDRLFKEVYITHGSLRKYNLNKEEEILNNETVDYPDFHTVPSFLKFAFYDEKKVDYQHKTNEEVAKNIANFAQIIWQIHPFIEGNTRTTCVFIENYLKSLGYQVDNHVFKENAEYFRNTLVRASYDNEELNVKKDIKPLENFFIAVLNQKEIEEQDLYVKELFAPRETKKKRKRRQY